MADGLKVRFWGVRGSISCSGAEYARYGGNTSCLEVTAAGRRLIFDAGTGNNGLKHGSAKLMCGGIGKSAGEAAHGGAGRRGNNDVGHAEILSYPSQGGRAS